MVWNGSNITNSISFYVNGVKTGYGFQQWIGTPSDNGQNKYYMGILVLELCHLMVLLTK